MCVCVIIIIIVIIVQNINFVNISFDTDTGYNHYCYINKHKSTVAFHLHIYANYRMLLNQNSVKLVKIFVENLCDSLLNEPINVMRAVSDLPNFSFF